MHTGGSGGGGGGGCVGGFATILNSNSGEAVE